MTATKMLENEIKKRNDDPRAEIMQMFDGEWHCTITTVDRSFGELNRLILVVGIGVTMSQAIRNAADLMRAKE